jgi:hypothetical protein
VSNRRMLAGSALAAVFGWGSLMYFTYAVRPSSFAISVAMVLLFVACLGTVTPMVYYLNLRFSDPERAGEHPRRPLRQSLFLASYVTLCVLLRTMHLLNWTFALFILGLMAMAEVTLVTWFD